MASNGNVISLKVFHLNNRRVKEVRRFSLEVELAQNYEYLCGKITSVFTDLLRKDLILMWQDEEEDYITISSDEELSDVLNQGNLKGCFKLFVRVKRRPNADCNEHHGVICDGCDSKIFGNRYKCTQCFDYDLCSACHGKCEHPADHEMLCISEPRIGPSHAFPFVYVKGLYGPRSRQANCHYEKKQGGCKKGNEQSCPNENECKENVQHFAKAFGLDPDVAMGLFIQFQDFLKRGNGDDKDDVEANCVKNLCKLFNENPEVYFNMIQRCFNGHKTCAAEEEKKEGEKKEKTEGVDLQSAPAKEIEGKKNNDGGVETKGSGNEQAKETTMEQMAAEFTQRLATDGVSINNLSDMMRQLYPQIPCGSQSSPVNPEDFVLVDKDKDNQRESKLEKVLRQMEAMGFENEGGWLRQLLIAKDLSIDKVLEALNPAH